MTLNCDITLQGTYQLFVEDESGNVTTDGLVHKNLVTDEGVKNFFHASVITGSMFGTATTYPEPSSTGRGTLKNTGAFSSDTSNVSASDIVLNNILGTETGSTAVPSGVGTGHDFTITADETNNKIIIAYTTYHRHLNSSGSNQTIGKVGIFSSNSASPNNPTFLFKLPTAVTIANTSALWVKHVLTIELPWQIQPFSHDVEKYDNTNTLISTTNYTGQHGLCARSSTGFVRNDAIRLFMLRQPVHTTTILNQNRIDSTTTVTTISSVGTPTQVISSTGRTITFTATTAANNGNIRSLVFGTAGSPSTTNLDVIYYKVVLDSPIVKTSSDTITWVINQNVTR